MTPTATLAGVGALGTAMKLNKAAEGGAMMRTRMTVLGQKTLPAGFIGVMRSSQGFSQAETNMRFVDLTVQVTANGLTGFGIRSQVRSSRVDTGTASARRPSGVSHR